MSDTRSSDDPGNKAAYNQAVEWRIRCSDDCGFIVKCHSEEQARRLASCENVHGETLVEARTVTCGEWLPGAMEGGSRE